MQDYQVIKQLGAGSFGRVVLARKRGCEQLMAIKQIQLGNLNEKERDAALNEIRLLASIQSPYVVAYYAAFFEQVNSTLCIVMEYADGGDLAGLISRKKEKSQKFSENYIWQVAYDLLRALRMLHASRILHRDIKPGNVFLAGGTAKLGDLNISKVVEGSFASTQAGTPYYTSPEIWQGQLYDGKCDIWSLGCLLYEMAALKPPFLAPDFPTLSKRVNKGYFDPLPINYSPRLCDIIACCLRVNPRERPQAGDLLKDSVFAYMAKAEEGSINLLSTIRCPKVLRMIQHKLPQAKSPNKAGSDLVHRPQPMIGKALSQQKLFSWREGEKENERSNSRSRQVSNHTSQNSQQDSQHSQHQNRGVGPSRGIIYRMESPNPYNRPILNSPQNIFRRP